MELNNALLTEPVSAPEVLPYTEGIENSPDEKKIQVAKQFESLLLNRLMEQMSNTIGQWDDKEDQAARGQIQGIFNMYMSEHVSDNGGFGIWKDIYKSLTEMQKQVDTPNSLDEQI
jgi:flagellar protein FlgJ